MNDKCRKCHKQPTEKSIKMFESWKSNYCPACFANLSMKRQDKTPIEPIESLGCEKNPVDCYWSFVTSSYLNSS